MLLFYTMRRMGLEGSCEVVRAEGGGNGEGAG